MQLYENIFNTWVISLSETGIEPLPEKLSSLQDMPLLTNMKEVQQFLGLAGYYRKLVPIFADISQPLIALTKEDVSCEWT